MALFPSVNDASLVSLDLSGRRVGHEGLTCLTVASGVSLPPVLSIWHALDDNDQIQAISPSHEKLTNPLSVQPLNMNTTYTMQDVLKLVNRSLVTLNLSQNHICNKVTSDICV